MGFDTLLTLLFLASILWSVVSGIARATGSAARRAREAAERARLETERRRLEREADPNRRSYETYLGRGPDSRPVDAAVPAAPPLAPGSESDQERLRRATAAKMGRPVEGGSPPRPPGFEGGSPPRPRPEAARPPRVEPAPPRPRPAADPFEMPPPRPSSLEGATLERGSAEGGSLERAPAPPRRELPPVPAGPPRAGAGAQETGVGRLARLAREDRETPAAAAAQEPDPTVKRGTAVLEPRAIVRAIVWSEVLGPPKSRRR